MSSETDQKLRESAQSPRRAKGEGLEVEQHSLPDQIAMDRHLANKQQARRGLRGLMSQMVPPGASVLALAAVIAWPLFGCTTTPPVYDRQAEVAARIRTALAENPQALATASPGVLAVARAEGLVP